MPNKNAPSSPSAPSSMPSPTSAPPDSSTPSPPGLAPDAPDSFGFRCGYIAILGKPNAGKSTLMNRLIGAKTAIVSPKPQTTRDRIHGIFTDDAAQMIFVDLPGLVEPRDRLNEALVAAIHEALGGADVVLHLIDAADIDPLAPPMDAVLRGVRAPVLAAINKVDQWSGTFSLERWIAGREGRFERDRYAEIYVISGLTGRGLEVLKGAIQKRLPEGPPLYDPEDLTDRDLRWLAGECVREQVFILCEEEIPYSTAVEIDEFSEREDGKWFIRAVVYIERDSQKGIVIGQSGQTLKKIGQAARVEIEKLTDHPVYLELWVKVRKNWRKKEHELKRFGYEAKKPPKRKK